MKVTSNKKAAIYVDLMGLADSYKLSRVFLTAVELQLFETIGYEHLTAKDIAARTGTDERATELLLNVLASLSMLERKGHKYRNAANIVEILRIEPCKPLMAAFRHSSNSWQTWSALTRVVKKGLPEKVPWSRKMSIDLAETMRLGAKDIADRLDLMIDFSAIQRICDMGCGPGTICMELMQKHPHLTAVLIDHDKYALDIASQHAAVNGLQDRVKIVNGNILNNEIHGHFDMVIMSLVLCLFSSKEVVHLLSKAKTILLPGGTLVLGEILLNQPGTAPVSKTLFNLQLLVNGSRGGLFSLEGIRELMRDCGIRYERNFPTAFHHIIVGRND